VELLPVGRVATKIPGNQQHVLLSMGMGTFQFGIYFRIRIELRGAKPQSGARNSGETG
jgi:hypothetical protein